MVDQTRGWLKRARGLVRAAGRRAERMWRHFDSDFAPVFLCGVAGSGTTLLSSLLDQGYDNAAVFHESALHFPTGTLLHMESVGHYGRLDRYAAAMRLSPRTDSQRLRAEMLALYRRRCVTPKTASAVIDKAPNVHLVRAEKLQAAFPAARFVLIFRDPVANLEGLRRKWSVFREAALEDLCDFWADVHHAFIEQTRRFDSRVRGLSFERLLSDPEGEVQQLARWCDLQPRTTPRAYTDRPNTPGKGLRGVEGGRIRVDPSAARARGDGLIDAERTTVEQRLATVYRDLVQRYEGADAPRETSP